MEGKNKKKINFITIVFITIVLAIIIGFFLGVIKKTTLNKQGKTSIIGSTDVSDEDTNEVEEIAENNDLEYDFEETDYGNKIDTNKKYVYTKDRKEYDYGFEDGSGDYNLQLFTINIDSDEINNINKEIEDYYNKYKSYYSNKEIIEKESEFPTQSYYYFTRDGILVLIIYYGNENDGYDKFKSYNIDIENKNVLSNEEFLEKLNINEEEFNSLLEESIFNQYIFELNINVPDGKTYKDFNEFKNDIKFTNISEEDSKSIELNYNNICKNCYIIYDYITNYEDSLVIKGIEIPSKFGSDAPLDLVYISKEHKHVFTNRYSYYIKDDDDNQSEKLVYNYSPIINLKSEDADRVNKELKDFFDKGKEAIEKNGGIVIVKSVETDQEMEISDGVFVKAKDEIVVNREGNQVIDNYYTINYLARVIDDKILLILVEETNSRYSNLDHGLNNFYVYNFDIETGKLLSNKELIEKCGYSVDDFKKQLTTTKDIDSINITFTDREGFYNCEKMDNKEIKGDMVSEFYVFKENNSFDWEEVNMNK